MTAVQAGRSPCELAFLLDTNVLSEPAKVEPDARVMSRLRRWRGQMATAAPVWHELFCGWLRLPPSRRRRTLEHYLMDVLAPSVPVLPYDARCAEVHAAERARLAALGRTPSFVDREIAATARTLDLILVTRNVSDYGGFEGLAIENWAE